MATRRDSTGHPLHGARLKHDYAVEQLTALEDVRAWLDVKRPKMDNSMHADRLGGDLKIRISEGPPEQWALRIATIVHHLRSALDHVAWAIAGDPELRPDEPPFRRAGRRKRSLPAPSGI